MRVEHFHGNKRKQTNQQQQQKKRDSYPCDACSSTIQEKPTTAHLVIFSHTYSMNNIVVCDIYSLDACA